MIWELKLFAFLFQSLILHVYSPIYIQGIPVILVVTGVSMMVLDPKNLTIKYRIELQYIKQLSLSTHSDHIFVVHIDPVSLSLFPCPFPPFLSFALYLASCMLDPSLSVNFSETRLFCIVCCRTWGRPESWVQGSLEPKLSFVGGKEGSVGSRVPFILI